MRSRRFFHGCEIDKTPGSDPAEDGCSDPAEDGSDGGPGSMEAGVSVFFLRMCKIDCEDTVSDL